VECLNLPKKRRSKQIDAINAELSDLASIVRAAADLTPQRALMPISCTCRCHLLGAHADAPKMTGDPDKTS